MTAAIEAHDVEVRFDRALALVGVELVVPSGSSLAVIGRNGSGKSSLLRAIAGTVELSSGTVRSADTALVLGHRRSKMRLGRTLKSAAAFIMGSASGQARTEWASLPTIL